MLSCVRAAPTFSAPAPRPRCRIPTCRCRKITLTQCPDACQIVRVDYSDLPRGQDDRLPIPEVGSWTREKYLRVWMYDHLFTTGMKNHWDEMVYVDLFAGSGFSRIRGTKEILLGSPLLATQIPDRFTRYIFCDRDPSNLEALRERAARFCPDLKVEYVPGDVDHTIGRVLEKIPRGHADHRVLTFCFVDPYSVGLRFHTIRRLAERYVDFLILLALGMDANLNLPLYLTGNNTRIQEFVDDPAWRSDWQKAEKQGEHFIPFLAKKYAEAMTRIRYLKTPQSKMYAVRSDQKNLPLYYLAFFSRSKQGYRFWSEVLKYADPQIGLDLDLG